MVEAEMEQGLETSDLNRIGLELIQARGLAKKQRLLTLLRAKKAQLGLTDLFYFAKFILGYKDVVEQPHRGMCDDLQNPNVFFKLNLEPRGSFKTTLTVAYVIQKIVKNPNIRVMIDCEDLGLAKKILGEIKQHFEKNQEFITLYGDFVVGSDKWDQSEIVVNKRNKIGLKDPTINTSSLEVNRVGAHIDLLIEDDLHSLLNTQSPERIATVIEHTKNNSSILDPGGERIVNGTRWAVMEYYGVIIEQEKARRKAGKKKWHVRMKDAEKSGPKGELYFPTRLTQDFLDDKKIELGSYVYSCQYKNNPIDDSAIIFKKHWIKFYGRFAPDNLIKTMVLDPAISQKDAACFSNLNVIGTDLDGFMYILDNMRFRAEPQDVIKAAFLMYAKWDVRVFGIETVAYQKALKFWFYERMRQTGVFLNIKELKTDTNISKDMRIRGLIPYVESGTVQFPGTGPYSLVEGILDLYTEMTEFPVGAYKDALDSLSYQLQLYTPAKGITERKPIIRDFQTVMKEERRKRVFKADDGLPLLGRHNIRPYENRIPVKIFQEVNL